LGKKINVERGLRRQGFVHVTSVVSDLIHALKEQGQHGKVALDMDTAMQREAMDIIGLVAFSRDFQMRKTLMNASSRDEFSTMARGD
jgi:hypothetical protein